MAGYVYCLTNSTIPGLVKIGKTARDPKERVAEISASTGVPTPFDIAWSRKVPDMHTAESDLHAALADFRLTKRREFFRCSPEVSLARAKKLTSFRAKQKNVKQRAKLDKRHGFALTAMIVGVFGSAVAFDLDVGTVATATAGLGLVLTMAFQSVPLVGALRG